MTMHLLPSYYTTTSVKKRKSKKRSASILAEEKKTQELLDRLGYVKNSKHTNDFPNYKSSTPGPKTSDKVGNGFKRDDKRYTGNEIAGIGVLHKSNLIPIRKDSSDAIDISKMRRG